MKKKRENFLFPFFFFLEIHRTSGLVCDFLFSLSEEYKRGDMKMIEKQKKDQKRYKIIFCSLPRSLFFLSFFFLRQRLHFSFWRFFGFVFQAFHIFLF